MVDGLSSACYFLLPVIGYLATKASFSAKYLHMHAKALKNVDSDAIGSTTTTVMTVSAHSIAIFFSRKQHPRVVVYILSYDYSFFKF